MGWWNVVHDRNTPQNEGKRHIGQNESAYDCGRMAGGKDYSSQKMVLSWKEPPMTVVAAQFCGDYILMAIDTQETHSQEGQEILTAFSPKLQRLAEIPVAWAFAGSVDVGEDFNRWLRDYQGISETDWPTFRGDAITELNRLNKAKRKSMRDAGVKPKSDNLCEVLVVGYISGTPEILWLNDKGETLFYKERRFAAIGSGQNHVQMVKWTLEQWFNDNHKPLPEHEALFFWIVAKGTQMAPQCGLPLQMVKVTPKGVETYIPPVS